MIMKRYKWITSLIVLLITATQWAGAQDKKGVYVSSEDWRTASIQNQNVEKGASLKHVLSLIESEYNVKFFYRSDLLPGMKLSEPHMLHFEKDLFEVLDELLSKFKFRYKVLTHRTIGILQDKTIPRPEEIIQETVTGRVTDASTGESLPGVNITVKGMSSVGTTTNVDGEYSLDVPEDQNVLLFSFVGFVAQEIEINDREVINVELQPDVQLLDDVVVVGYGTQEKRQITGSVSSVKEEDFVTGNVNNPAQLIQGKVPGLVVSTPGGNPNQDATIRLRGVSTFSANQEPLIVVDGIIGASLRNVDPNDIESIDVLKDASAASIYGTRAAAGVIVITTKKGESGETQVSYNGSVSVLDVESKTNVLSADEFRELGDITGLPIIDLGASTDWFDEITQTGTNQIHNLSVSGGNATTNYRISGNFRDNNGIQKRTGFQSQNLRLNLSHTALNERLRLTGNFSGTNREENRGFDEAFRYATIFNPTAPVRDPNGQIRSDGFSNTGGFVELQVFDTFNPVAIIETAENNAKQRRLNISLKGDVILDDFVKGLTSSVFYSLETENESNNVFFSKNNKLVGRATQSSLGQGRAERSSFESTSELFEITTNYVADLQRLSIEILGGYSWQEFESGGTFVGGGDFVSDGVKSNNLQFIQDFNNGLGDISSFEETNTLIASFGRLSLNFDDTYFLNGSVRREGSSRFGENERWGMFWSIGGGIEVTNLFEINRISSLRFRASYGISGQDAPDNNLSKLRFAPRGNFFAGDRFTQSFGPVSNPNPDLKWEENKELNIGIEVLAIDNKLELIAEYYSKTTDDLLFQLQVPVPPNLFPLTWENIGQLDNNGFELSLGYDMIRDQNTRWNSLVTFATFDIELAEFVDENARTIANLGAPGQNGIDLVRIKSGEKLGQLWGPRFAGVDENGNELFFAGDGSKIVAGDLSREDDTVIGNGLPDFQIGWTNTVNFKSWDFTAFFRGTFGHDLINTQRAFFELPSNITQWNVSETAFDFTDITSSPRFNDRHVENASYFRFENFTIGYTPSIGNFLDIRRLRIYLSGNNLFTITGYNGIDPQVRFEDTGSDAGALAPGIERREQWFTTRSWTVGINLDF